MKPQYGSDNDIHFHMSIRFHENCIVRNTKQSGRWGSEERGGGLPLSKGQHFQMMISVNQYCLKVCLSSVIDSVVQMCVCGCQIEEGLNRERGLSRR